jgi:hypothetical protein
MRPVLRPLAALAALSVLGGGCASGPVPGLSAGSNTLPTAEVCSAEVAQALAYFSRLRGLPRAELARELERSRAAYAADPSPAHRLRLALLLAMPGGPAEDERRAVALLQGQRSQASDASLRDLCQLLEVLLAAEIERESRLQALLDDQKEKRQRIAGLERDLKQALGHGRDQELRVLALQRALAREQAEAATRQRQLEELRKIESSLESRRGAPLSVRPPDEPEQGQNPPGR